MPNTKHRKKSQLQSNVLMHKQYTKSTTSPIHSSVDITLIAPQLENEHVSCLDMANAA